MNHKTTPQQPIQNAMQRHLDAASMMDELWSRTADTLSPEELDWFAGCTEHGLHAMQNLEDVISTVAGFVVDDVTTKTGGFQDTGGATSLLLTITQSLNSIRGMIEVGQDASARLAKPELYQQIQKAMTQGKKADL